MYPSKLTSYEYSHGVTKTKALPKITEQTLETVRDGPSNIETYSRQDQNFERVSLGLESRPRDMQAVCRDWDVRWSEASKK